MNTEIDDEDDEKIIGYPCNFLITYLIEFFILKNNSSYLEEYLSSIRVGGAKKYAKDLIKIYVSSI